MANKNLTIDDQLFTVKEAAELLRVSVRFVNQRFSTGDLRRIKLGRATRIRRSDHMRLIEQGAQ